MRKSKSCEEIIEHNDLQNQNENNDLSETISLQLNTNSLNERWHNRFSKENRQKLISQQQAIDQKVKLTKEANKRQQDSSHSIRSKLSTTLKRPTTLLASTPSDHSDSITDNHSSYSDNRNNRRQPFFNVTRVSLTRSPHQESYAKMQQEDDEDNDSDNLSISYISDKRTISQQKSKIYNINEDLHISDINHPNNDNDEEMILTAAKLTPLTISSPPTVSSNSIINTSRC
jgi:hypothetical protein